MLVEMGKTKPNPKRENLWLGKKKLPLLSGVKAEG